MCGKPTKISVVVPVYNVENYLQACIDSLLGQTLEDIELIFVNDASTDCSLEILERNARDFPERLKIIDLHENLCQGGARNHGIKAAQSEYIGFVDSDDMVHPEMFETLYRKAIDTRADATFIQYTSVPADEKLSMAIKNGGRPLVQWSKDILELDCTELDDFGRMDLMCHLIGGCWCGLWRKNLIIENNVLFPEHLKYEDNYWVSLLKCYINKVAFVPQVMYYYRNNSSSTVRQRNAQYHMDRIDIEKRLLKDVRDRGVFDKYYEAWEYMYITRYAFNSYYLFCGIFDRPPFGKMKLLMDDLKLEFPKWEKNRYYQKLVSNKLKNKVVSIFPYQYAKIHYYYHYIKRKLFDYN